VESLDTLKTWLVQLLILGLYGKMVPGVQVEVVDGPQLLLLLAPLLQMKVVAVQALVQVGEGEVVEAVVEVGEVAVRKEVTEQNHLE
jgi:hypothetical protein